MVLLERMREDRVKAEEDRFFWLWGHTSESQDRETRFTVLKKMMLKVTDCNKPTLWTIWSMEFSRPEYWSG